MKVLLLNLEFYAYHGLYDFEKQDGGKYVVDVEIEEPEKGSYMLITDVINYETVFSIVENQMNHPKEFIEEVARLIVNDLRKEFPQALSGKVSITKCAPPIPGMKGEAKVEYLF